MPFPHLRPEPTAREDAERVLPVQSGAIDAFDLVGAIGVPAALLRGRHIQFANEALARLTGRRSPQLVSVDFGEFVDSTCRRDWLEALDQCANGVDEPPVMEIVMITSYGGLRPVELHMKPLRVGGQSCVMVTCVDQSDVQHVQQGLMSMTELLQQIIDGASVACLVVDQNHRLSHWNAACERLTRVSRSELLGSRDAWKAFYLNERPLLADLVVDQAGEEELNVHYGDKWRYSDVVNGGVEVEAFFPKFGDGGKWLFFTAAPIRNARGEINGAIETLQDVTAKRNSADALQRHRQELERLVQQRSSELAASVLELENFVANSPIGVACSVNGRMTKANKAFADMFGFPDEHLEGVPGRDFYPSDEDYAAFGAEAGPLLGAGQKVHTERWMRHQSGKPIWIQVDAHVVDVNEPSRGTWWVMQDRTEILAAQSLLQQRIEELNETNAKLEEAQNQLLQQDKMASIGQLAAGVAHEINNPIAFITSNVGSLKQYLKQLLDAKTALYAAAAQSGVPGFQETAEQIRTQYEIEYLKEDVPLLLEECSDGLDRVRRIVQDLKDFSRVDHAEWGDADLNRGVESTLNVVRNELKYKAEVVCRLQPLPAVRCVAAQLNQVFMNLIVNAGHAIEKRGTIVLTSGHEGPWAWVQVTDSGCGMSAEVMRRVFEPFFTTKDVGKGTGLGLSVSFSIVQRHRGRIDVQSMPGQGTAFRVWVPVRGPESVEEGVTPPSWEWPEADCKDPGASDGAR